MMKQNKGITLIALIVTVVVLLILATITIKTFVVDNGTINRAQQAKAETEIAELKDRITVDLIKAERAAVIQGRAITNTDIKNVLKRYGTVTEDGTGKIKGVTTKQGGYEILLEDVYNID